MLPLGLRPRDLFPAWAGVILLIISLTAYQISIPRMGGGDPSSRP